ncbi:acyl-CoA-binding protein [Hymenobacter psychrophilus]|uniref:Acyl-CoA-binding protein n=1 Tax=Hymenobacter psychrophilus TaxID=651662 RepID=A0A1H3M3F6_9BACT|nr:acyl-CoA-binding protein [Hymenobacter psychrophilus]SDY70798.1 Acyl-CoA-binding protein [Hymenobacter psychrophilus]
MSLQQDFEAATSRIDQLPGEMAAAHMTELYGLYKQATDGDHDAKRDEVGDDTPDNPSGPGGLSQGQWDAWSKCKGMSHEEAKQQYISRANEIAGEYQQGKPEALSQDSLGAPGTAGASPVAQAQQQAGQSQPGGLSGSIKEGTPYGGEDELKNKQ